MFLAGTTLLFQDSIDKSALTSIWAEWAWLPGLAAIIVSGHLMLGLFFLTRRDASKPDFAKLSNDKAGLAFRVIMEARMAERGIEPVKFSFNDLRSLAMSSCNEAADIGRRFMFIALFCFGSGTAMVVLAALVPLGTIPILPACLLWKTLLAAFFLASGVRVMRRGREFERRAYIVPFIVAIATQTLDRPYSSAAHTKDA